MMGTPPVFFLLVFLLARTQSQPKFDEAERAIIEEILSSLPENDVGSLGYLHCRDNSTGRLTVKITLTDYFRLFNTPKGYLLSIRNSVDYERIEDPNRFVLKFTCLNEGTGKKAEFSINIRIQDVNDNSPIFVSKNDVYRTSIPEVMKKEDRSKPIYDQIFVRDLDGTEANSDVILECLNVLAINNLTNCSGLFHFERKQNGSGLFQFYLYADAEAYIPTSYVITIRAKNVPQNKNFKTLWSVDETVIVKAVDIQNRAPKILPASLQLEINENQPLGCLQHFLEAYDQDVTVPNDIGFETAIYLEDPFAFLENLFYLGPSIPPAAGKNVWRAQLCLNNSLDREAIKNEFDQLYLSIIAQEYPPNNRADTPTQNASEVLRITVLDANDEPPEFEKKKYTAYVLEKTGPIKPDDADKEEQILSDILVEDKDRRIMYSRFVLDFVSGNEDKIFFLRNYTGVRRHSFVLYARRHILDYEKNSNNYSITLRATDQANPQLQSTTHINIVVLNVNDNSPVFREKRYNFSLTENSPNGTVAGRVIAIDPDVGDSISFSLEGAENMFKIDKDGIVRLVGVLDYEERRSYQLSVLAEDEGRGMAQALLTIDVENIDDGRLSFTAPLYTAYLTEWKKDLLPPVDARAVNQESNIPVVYSVLKVEPPELERMFELDPTNGSLSVVGDIDYGKTANGSISLKIQAKSGISNASAEVRIAVEDMNDFPPRFQPEGMEQYTISVSELVKPGGVVYKATTIDADKTHPDFSTVTYSLQGGGFDHFRIHPTDGEVSVTRNLDADGIDEYTLILQARDKGKPQRSSTAKVVVKVEDRNNKPPFFITPVVIATVSEDATVGQSITNVTAKDPDTNNFIRYSLNFSGASFMRQFEDVSSNINGSEFFSINQSGVLQVAGKLSRIELFDSSTFYIQAEDIRAEAGLPRQIAQVETKVTVTGSKYQRIYFELRNGSRSINPTIVIPYPETPKGASISRILSINAFDPVQSRRVTNFQEIESADAENFFIVSQGAVSLRKPLDYEALGDNKQISTVVLAISDDGRRSSSAAVVLNVLDINDNKPEFDRPFYNFTISESAKYPTIVGISRAIDKDSGTYADIRFQLSGLNSDLFFVGEQSGNSGKIMVGSGTDLDHEKTSVYTFQIVAMDNPQGNGTNQQKSAVPVTINVLDANDNTPTFAERVYNFTVIGTKKVGSVAGEVRAFDEDQGEFGKVYYSISSATNGGEKYFVIETVGQRSARPGEELRVGVLKIARSLEDLPERTVFILTLTATDNEVATRPEQRNTGSCTAILTVVRGVMDPLPKWDVGLKTNVSILENSTYGHFVTRLTARPANSSSYIVYSIVEGGDDDYKKFKIDENTGDITVADDLDYEQKKVHTLLVKAMDAANKTLSSQFLLLVYIIDVDDNMPSFLTCPGKRHNIPDYARVKEALEPAIFVYQAKACDLDEKAYNKMVYTWFTDDTYCNPSISDVFSLEKDTGKVYTKKKLDREEISSYLLCIQVDVKQRTTGDRRKRDMVQDLRDRKNHDKVQYCVVIVEDENDNGPSFEKAFLRKVILEKPSENIIYIAEVSDPDQPPYNKVYYKIESIQFIINGKNHSQPAAFLINGDTGDLLANFEHYNEFSDGYFDVLVRASDAGNASLYDQQVVRVYVTDTYHQFRVVLNEPGGASVQQKVDDMVKELNDLGRMYYQVQSVSYHIIDNSQNPAFHKTDVCMVAVKRDTILTPSEASKELYKEEENKIIASYGARDPGPCESAMSIYPEGWESYWWVLVAFAIFIFILVLILIVLIIILHRQYKNYMDTRQTYLVPGEYQTK